MFYLSEQNNKEQLEIYLDLLKKFFSKKKIQSNNKLICESIFDYNYLISNYQRYKININIICIEKYLSKKIILNRNDSIKFRKIIKKKNFQLIDENYNNNDLSKIFKILYDQLKLQILNNKIKCIILNQGNGIFKSSIVVLLQEICDLLKIKVIMPFTSPIKGRFSIYESIYFYNKTLIKDYKNHLKKNTKIRLKKITPFINEYLSKENKSKIRNSRFIPRVNLLQKIVDSLFYLYFDLNNFNNKQFDYKNNNKEYVLIMLSKKHQWFNNYANQDLTDRLILIKKIINSIPKNYNIVLRFHPRESRKIDTKFFKYICTHDNLFISLDQNQNETLNIVKNSKLVISYGSSSVIPALMMKKNIIEVGKYSIFFPMNNAPINRILDLKKLKIQLKNIINKKISEKKVNSYLLSVYNTSYALSYRKKLSRKNPFFHFKIMKNDSLEFVNIIYRYLIKNKLV